MRAAICFSGHTRNINKLTDNWFTFFYFLKRKGYDLDFFFSIWNQADTDQSWSNRDKFDNYNRPDFDFIINRFNPISLEIESFDKIKDIFNCYYYGLNSFPENISKNNILFSIPMFYKIFQCNELKKKNEARLKTKYDLVIRFRSNLIFNLSENFNFDFSYGTLYGKEKNDTNKLCDDIFLISDSLYANKWSDTYLQLKDIFTKHGVNGPESILYTNCFLMDDLKFSLLPANLKPELDKTY